MGQDASDIENHLFMKAKTKVTYILIWVIPSLKIFQAPQYTI